MALEVRLTMVISRGSQLTRTATSLSIGYPCSCGHVVVFGPAKLCLTRCYCPKVKLLSIFLEPARVCFHENAKRDVWVVTEGATFGLLYYLPRGGRQMVYCSS